ncbi:MAG: hypothetical protein WDM81_20620 [Rhizomicrobium sp.]
MPSNKRMSVAAPMPNTAALQMRQRQRAAQHQQAVRREGEHDVEDPVLHVHPIGALALHAPYRNAI